MSMENQDTTQRMKAWLAFEIGHEDIDHKAEAFRECRALLDTHGTSFVIEVEQLHLNSRRNLAQILKDDHSGQKRECFRVMAFSRVLLKHKEVSNG